MKAKDIKVGEHYAIEMHQDFFRRAVVVRVGDVTRKVYHNSRSFYGVNSTSKMATVVFVHTNTGLAQDARAEHVVLAKVVHTWDAYCDIDAAKHEREESLDHSLASIEKDFEDVTGVRLYFARNSFGQRNAGTATITASEVKKALEAITSEVHA